MNSESEYKDKILLSIAIPTKKQAYIFRQKFKKFARSNRKNLNLL